MQSAEALSESFDRFARLEVRGFSPLYDMLATGISADPEMLSLAAHARSGQPAPNLFLAAAHWLLLKGADHPVSAYYPSIAGASTGDGDPYPHFRSFCLEHRQEIIGLISTRLVQTNVVNRCASLMPAFASMALRSNGQPISLVEIGASAGLNLLWDRYGYSYGDGLTYGDAASPVQVSCTLRGSHRPPIPDVLPPVVSRLGLDLNPIDLNDPEATQWLIALVWPERGDERELLRAAIKLSQTDPPVVIPGDALELLPNVCKSVPQDSTLCIFHSHTLNQFSHEARARWWEIIEQIGSERDIWVVSQEIERGRDHAAVELTWIENGVMERRHLANCDSHSQWLEWLDPETKDKMSDNEPV